MRTLNHDMFVHFSSGLRALGTALLVLGALCLAPPSASAATSGAPVRLTTVTADTAAATVGQRVTFDASGRGLRTAGRTRVTFHLSSDARLDEDDLRVGAATITSVRRNRTFSVRVAAKIPSAAGLRASQILACVAYRVRGRERCTCRAAKTPIATQNRPKPMTASPVLQTAGAVTRQVGPAGGTLRTTAADGTSLTLTVPANALTDSETITMTPIGALGGLRRSGLSAGGATFAPEGLLLQQPATLRIVPPRPVADERVTGYAFQGGGSEFHFKPAVPDGAAIEVEVPHFSGVGAASATTETRRAVTGSAEPTAPSDQAEQAEALNDAELDYYGRLGMESGAKGSAGATGDPVEDLYTLTSVAAGWTTWRKATMDEAAALQASGAVPRAKEIAAYWIRRSWDLLRWNYPQKLVLAGLACANEHRLEAATALRYVADRMRALPDPLDATFTSEEQRADALILGCLNFEVQVSTNLRASAGDDVTMETQATIPLRIERIRPDRFSGEAIPEVRSYTVTAPSCWTHPPANLQPTTVRADRLTLAGLTGRPRTFFFGKEVDKGRIQSFHLNMGTIRETVTHEARCEGLETFTNEMNIYNAGVAALAAGSGGMGLRNGTGLPATPATELYVNELQRLDEDTWLREMATSNESRVSGQIRVVLNHRPKKVG